MLLYSTPIFSPLYVMFCKHTYRHDSVLYTLLLLFWRFFLFPAQKLFTSLKGMQYYYDYLLWIHATFIHFSPTYVIFDTKTCTHLFCQPPVSTARVFGQTLWKFLSRIFPPWKDIFLLLVFPSLLFFFLYFVIFPLFQDYLQTVNSPAKTEITLQIDGWILTIFLELRGLPRPNFEAFVSSFEGFLCCLLTSNVEDYKCLLIFFFGEKILFGVPAKTTLGGFSF